MTSALVTGATGFIGSHLVEELISGGRDVSCVIRTSSDLRWLKDRPVDFVNWDLVDGTPPLDHLTDVEEVYHVAGITTSHEKDAFYRVNAGTVPTLIDALHRSGAPVRRFVQISSLAAAGPSFDRTARTEMEPCNPVSHYGKSKRKGEVLLRRDIGDIPYTIVRPPVVAGPRDEMILDMVEMVTNRIVPKFGRYKTYSYISVHDLVRGILRAAEAPEAKDETYFLSGPEQVEWTAFMETIGDELDIDPLILPLPDVSASVLAAIAKRTDVVPGLKDSFTEDKARELRQPSWLCSSEKAEREFDFSPRYDFRRTMEETINWYREAGWLPSS